jgi:DNA-binding beta-propeller fold protein YncE
MFIVALAGCGGQAPAPAASNQTYPATGLVLLSLTDGSKRGSASVGTDPVAVTVSPDGAFAFVADSAPGDVYGVKLPELTIAWKQHLGGAPFGLLAQAGSLFVSLYDGGAVVELNPTTGARVRSVPVTPRPAAISVDLSGQVIVASTSGHVEYLDGSHLAGGEGFGVATAGGQIWTGDYARAEVVRSDGRRVGLPLRVFPFWLASGSSGHLLIAAEGAHEDSDPGEVFDLNTATLQFTTLATPRDPDQVVMAGSRVFVPAHGDDQVLVIDSSSTQAWAQGIAPVGLAVEPTHNLLVVVTNSHE